MGPKPNKTPLWVSAFLEYFSGVLFVGFFFFCDCLPLVVFYVFYCIDIQALLEGKILQPFIKKVPVKMSSIQLWET